MKAADEAVQRPRLPGQDCILKDLQGVPPTFPDIGHIPRLQKLAEGAAAAGAPALFHPATAGP